MSEPQRSCVACRTRRPQRTLIRLRRRSDGVVVPAVRRRGANHGGGRSAYLCPRHTCFSQAIRRRALERSLSGGTRRGHSVRVIGPSLDVLWPQVLVALDLEIQSLQRSGAIGHSPRHDALTKLRRELCEPGRSA